MYNSEPQVKVLADSISPTGKRLITLELTYWRAIHAEVLKHRLLASNSRSSRARPITSMIDEARNNTWGPNHWTLNQPGMVGKEITDEYTKSLYRNMWMSYAEDICKKIENQINMSKYLQGPQLHKQVFNRLLEPYTSISQVISGTEWKNFFNLRISEFAEPNMRDLAVAIQEAMNKSNPIELSYGEYHLPYISDEDRSNYSIDDLKLISTARCARVSYAPFNNEKANPSKDLALAKSLLTNHHMSAFEHIATPVGKHKYIDNPFIGWNQYRQEVDDFSR